MEGMLPRMEGMQGSQCGRTAAAVIGATRSMSCTTLGRGVRNQGIPNSVLLPTIRTWLCDITMEFNNDPKAPSHNKLQLNNLPTQINLCAEIPFFSFFNNNNSQSISVSL